MSIVPSATFLSNKKIAWKRDNAKLLESLMGLSLTTHWDQDIKWLEAWSLGHTLVLYFLVVKYHLFLNSIIDYNHEEKLETTNKWEWNWKMKIRTSTHDFSGHCFLCNFIIIVVMRYAHLLLSGMFALYVHKIRSKAGSKGSKKKFGIFICYSCLKNKEVCCIVTSDGHRMLNPVSQWMQIYTYLFTFSSGVVVKVVQK